MITCPGYTCPKKETCERYIRHAEKEWKHCYAECPIRDGECEKYVENHVEKKD